MLGYATGRADLAQLGTAPPVLRTGDLGYLDGGYLYVTGRAKRIAKLFGQRVSLDEIERMLPPDSAAVSDDRTLYLVTTAATDRDHAGEIAALLDVPERMVAQVPLDALPRTGSGKTDYPAVLGRVLAGAAAAASMTIG
jgi:acyl-CoA synthetase (AMP-forming)/AMP-acid ligase II